MTYTSILDKLQYLFRLISASYVYIGFIVLIVLMWVLLLFKKVNKRKFEVILLILYLSLFGVVIFNNYKSLMVVVDSVVTDLFTNIYFPSVYMYLFVLLVVDVVFVISFFSKKQERIFKIINTVCFCLMQFVFVIIMDLVAKGDIDVFSEVSLFTDVNLVAMLELSINIFIAWVIVIAAIYIINGITDRISAQSVDKVLVSESAVMNDGLVDSNSSFDVNLGYDYSDNMTFDDNNSFGNDLSDDGSYGLNDLVLLSETMEGDSVDSSSGLALDSGVVVNKIIDNPVIENSTNVVINNDVVVNDVNSDNSNLDSSSVLDMILNNSLPPIRDNVEKDNSVVLEEKDVTNYTLNDYKIFNRMLKEIRMYNVGSIVNIDKSLEVRILDKFTLDEYMLFKKMLKSYSS